MTASATPENYTTLTDVTVLARAASPLPLLNLEIRRTTRKPPARTEVELPRFAGRVGFRRACLGHHVSFRIRWAKDSPGPSGGVRDCRSLR
jgi:hypothetical protein